VSTLNAVACPAGTIFVNSGLLEIVESDEELEAILAHEIAHVEKRHGLRQYRTAQAGAAVGAILTLGIAAAAASDGNSDAAAAAVGITGVMVHIGSTIALTGYSRSLEMEADQYAGMYLLHNGKDPALLSMMLRKFRYFNDRVGITDRHRSMFSTHPGLKERIFIAENTETKQFEKKTIFDGYTRRDELVATLQFEAEFLHKHAQGRKTLTVLCELQTTTALEKQVKVKGITVTVGGRSIELDNAENAPVDPMDNISISFQTDGKQVGFLNDVEGIKLTLGPVRKWIRRNN
jgi:predicted Zn-dependent protease